MLHAPVSAWLESTDLWREIVSQRAKFYTRNPHALAGYARRQAAKYGIKGSRLEAAKKALETLRSLPPGARLGKYWDNLPEGEYLTKRTQVKGRVSNDCAITPADDLDSQGWLRVWDVCGKILLESAAVDHYIPMLERFIENYGERARMAERSEGIDWKAMSHAIRAAMQVVYILRDGGFAYPLPESDLLRKVKNGQMPFPMVAAGLDAWMDEVEALAAKSTLPENVNVKTMEEWLCRKVEDHLKGNAREKMPRMPCPHAEYGSCYSPEGKRGCGEGCHCGCHAVRWPDSPCSICGAEPYHSCLVDKHLARKDPA
jgi:hypothetical protein